MNTILAKPARSLADGHRRLYVFLCVTASCLLLLLSSCRVGPKYKRPPLPPPGVQGPAPEISPSDGVEAGSAQRRARGKWWEIYNDPQLNALEEQVSISNQNVLAAEAQFREAKDAVRIARSGLFPTVTASPSIVNSRTS